MRFAFADPPYLGCGQGGFAQARLSYPYLPPDFDGYEASLLFVRYRRRT